MGIDKESFITGGTSLLQLRDIHQLKLQKIHTRPQKLSHKSKSKYYKILYEYKLIFQAQYHMQSKSK